MRIVPDSLYKVLMKRTSDPQVENLEENVTVLKNEKKYPDDVKILMIQDAIRRLYDKQTELEKKPILVENISKQDEIKTESKRIGIKKFIGNQIVTKRTENILDFLESAGVSVDENTLEIYLKDNNVPGTNANLIIKALTNKQAAKKSTTGLDEVKNFMIAAHVPKNLFTAGMQAILFGSPVKKMQIPKRWSRF